MKHYGRFAFVLLGLWIQPFTTAHAQGVPVPEPRQRHGVVVVINGAGDGTAMTENMVEILGKDGIPLAVHTIRWCRKDSMAGDHADYDGQLRAARRVSNYVKNYRAAYPQEKIFLLAHSDGTHIALAATEMLPENSVERIILLAATVSHKYDLRPALLSSRGGIDHLFSTWDEYIPQGVNLSGTSDGRFVTAAGEHGFTVPPPNRPGARLYANLRQYPWTTKYSWTGNLGGHYGFTYECFLRAYVVPMLLTPAVRVH